MNVLNQPIVLVMDPDPDPYEVIAIPHGKRAMSRANPCGPEFADLLKTQRWMAWIGF